MFSNPQRKMARLSVLFGGWANIIDAAVQIFVKNSLRKTEPNVLKRMKITTIAQGKLSTHILQPEL